MRIAIRTGMNMIYTPLFTPPLDTRVGTERTTVQLVDVFFDNGIYTFNFDKLTKWINLARKCGFKIFEFSHMFTQWGAAHAPKIMGHKNGEYIRLFGWETDALSDEYRDFLNQFYISFNEFLSTKKGDFYFHISDEPHLHNIEQYLKAYETISSRVSNCKIMDAVSVYPATKGPIKSIRTVVFYEALQDLAAFKLLESLSSRDEVFQNFREKRTNNRYSL